MNVTQAGTPTNSFTSICRCGHPWRWHEQSGQTGVPRGRFGEHRPCWGYIGQSTPRTVRLCDCPSFEPWRTEDSNRESGQG